MPALGHHCDICLNQSHYSGVYSTDATGAIAPVILRKMLIVPVILHLPFSVIQLENCYKNFFCAARTCIMYHLQ